MNFPLFSPSYGLSVNVVGAVASANVELTSAARPLGPTAAVELLNVGTQVMFVKFGGDNSVAATSADYPVGPGDRVVLPMPSFATGSVWVAAISPAVGSTLYCTGGSTN